jgi:asparagine synthetase B (glutamine-hydrolysing)
MNISPRKVPVMSKGSPDFTLHVNVRKTGLVASGVFDTSWPTSLECHQAGRDDFEETISGHRVVMFGYAALGSIRDPRTIANLVAGGRDEDLRRLNGEFLFLHWVAEQPKLRVITSRYGYPTFWFHHTQGSVRAARSFERLGELLKADGLLEIADEALFDLLHYKRVFGDKTPARNSRLLGPAQILEISPDGLVQHQYWRPDFRRKRSISLEEAAEVLASDLVQAVTRQTAGTKTRALFLTGGLDSRLVLAACQAAHRPVVALTVNVTENGETRIAAEAAALAGMEHRHVRIPESHYSDMFSDAVGLAGAMYLPMPLLYGLEKYIPEGLDIAFHGHGLDYFFQGLYLPSSSLSIMGRKLDWRRQTGFIGPPLDFFLSNISYRTKGTNPANVMKPLEAARHGERLRDELISVANDAQEVCEYSEDVLDFLSFHNLARHYSCSDHWSINTAVEQRTIAFDNDLYEFYQELPASLRFDGRVARRCLELLSPNLAQLVSSNSTYPICLSSAERTVWQLAMAPLRRLGAVPPLPDPWFERSGLPIPYLLSNTWRPFLHALSVSPRLERIAFIDPGRVHETARQALDAPNPGYDTALLALITMDQFLKRIER